MSLEAHPIYRLPTREEAVKLGPEGCRKWLEKRQDCIDKEKLDPKKFGFRPAIWDAVDDLLVDGNRVILDFSRIQKLMPDKDTPFVFDGPKEIIGAPEIWIAGSKRSSKSEYAGQKVDEILLEQNQARCWCFADTASISIARQQPVIWKYLPYEIRRLCSKTGRWKQGHETNIAYNPKTGFSDANLLVRGGQLWFKNYEQDVANAEGDKLHVVWLDELRDTTLLKALRHRMGDYGGLIIVTFTSFNENYGVIVNEYDKGSKTVLEVPAELLPIKDPEGKETGRFEPVPRIKVAGPGSDGDQRANIVYFHITDNPFYGFGAKQSAKAAVFGKERFYKILRGANREKILANAYGILTSGAATQFPKFKDTIHVVTPVKIPKEGTNYHIVDPCDGRNWFMIWVRITKAGKWYVYREWPSHGHVDAYIPAVGDPGPWAVPGKAIDGDRGPAQKPFGFGLDRYIREIERVEKHGLEDAEQIDERWMDSRYGASPTTTTEGSTTLIEQMADLGMIFLAASGKSIEEGVTLINDKLDYDNEVDIGQFSKTLARINNPVLYVSANCPNMIYSLREWTNKDKQHGACKDPIDCLRYAVMANLDYIGSDAYTWKGGGTY